MINQSINQSIIEGYVPEPLKQSDVVPVLKCSPPKSVEELDQDLTSHLANGSRADLHCLPFWIKSAINLMFIVLHLRENGPPTLLFIFSSPFFSRLTKAIRKFVCSLLISAKDSTWWTTTSDASSRVVAPRRTRSYHSLDQIFFDRSSAASKTVEGSHKERNLIAPFLFAILVTNLCGNWRNRLKFICWWYFSLGLHQVTCLSLLQISTHICFRTRNEA